MSESLKTIPLWLDAPNVHWCAQSETNETDDHHLMGEKRHVYDANYNNAVLPLLYGVMKTKISKVWQVYDENMTTQQQILSPAEMGSRGYWIVINNFCLE